ncbi:MAG: AMP-binding protein, partial [Acidimicrobiia bacterium]
MTAVAERAPSAARRTGHSTVASEAREWSERTPAGVAMREKDLGIWREITWASLWADVLAAAHGLLALGVRPGDRVSIQSEDRPEWVILDLATVVVRGVTVGLYPTNPEAEVQYLLADSGSRVHLA